MNAYSFIFWPIIEGEGAGVKAKVFPSCVKDFFGQVQGSVGRWWQQLAINAFLPNGFGVKCRTPFLGHFTNDSTGIIDNLEKSRGNFDEDSGCWFRGQGACRGLEIAADP